MLFGIELLPDCFNSLKTPVLLQCRVQLGVYHQHPVMHLGIILGGLSSFQSTVEIVKRLQKVADQGLVGKLDGFFLVTDETFSIILKICTVAKHLLLQGGNLTLRCCKLFFQLHDFQLLLFKFRRDITFLSCCFRRSRSLLLGFNSLSGCSFHFILCIRLAFLIFLFHSIPRFPIRQNRVLAHVYL
ncbi:hypothetical protein SDC9_149498 [bioreactor metagenome]|uniref:Uncharacterized protein n=1 Tax=bioreactor metagenome TaxID=1076179 RepID=A0A645ENQ7_9ZZZZ